MIDDFVKSTDSPLEGAKRGKDTSMWLAIESVKKREADIIISAGNTGAMFVGGFYSVKAIPGILRPPLSTIVPREDGGVTVLLDVGANADCKADTLYQFGILGSLFSEHICNIKKYIIPITSIFARS